MRKNYICKLQRVRSVSKNKYCTDQFESEIGNFVILWRHRYNQIEHKDNLGAKFGRDDTKSKQNLQITVLIIQGRFENYIESSNIKIRKEILSWLQLSNLASNSTCIDHFTLAIVPEMSQHQHSLPLQVLRDASTRVMCSTVSEESASLAELCSTVAGCMLLCLLFIFWYGNLLRITYLLF